MSDLLSRVTALNAVRLNVWEQAKALLDSAAGREMTGEERASFEAMNKRIGEIDAEVRELVATERRERESEQLRENALQLFGEAGVRDREKREGDRLRAWIANGMQGDFEVNIAAAAKERELLRAGASAQEIRNVIQTDATSGSLVVPTTLDRRLWEVLEANIAAFRMPASRFNTSTSEPLNLPTLLTHGIGTQIATQDTAIAGTDATFGQVALNAYDYGQLVHVSERLVRDSAFDIASWLGDNIGRAIARVVDADLVVGTGSSEPTGMMTYAGSGTNAPIKTGGSLVTPTVEKWLDLVYSVNSGARDTGQAAFLVKDSTAGTMRKLRDGAGGTVGAFLWAPSLFNGVQEGQPDRFLGYPVYTDPNVAAQGSDATIAAFGDWSQYAVRTVSNPVIESTPYFKWDKNQISFRGKWAVGGNHTQKSHINVMIQNV